MGRKALSLSAPASTLSMSCLKSVLRCDSQLLRRIRHRGRYGLGRVLRPQGALPGSLVLSPWLGVSESALALWGPLQVLVWQLRARRNHKLCSG